MTDSEVLEVLTNERDYWKRKYEMHKHNPSEIIRKPYERKYKALERAIEVIEKELDL